MRQLIVLVDALGWITVERLGFLRDRLPFRRRLTTVFGYSSTAIPSLLTGAWPREHGHWFLFRRLRGRSPFPGAGLAARAPFGLGDRWRVRMRLQEFWRRRAGIDGYFSLYEVPLELLPELEPVETEDTWGRGTFPSTPSLVDHLHERGEPFHVSDWRVPDAEKIAAAHRALEEGDPRTVVLYLTEVDAVQHNAGTLHPDFEAKVRETGEWVEELVARMERRGPLGVSLFSDHGMTDIVRHEPIAGPLAAAGLRRGRDFQGFYDSTVARFWDVSDRPALTRALEGLGWGRLLDEETLARWGCDFPDREYGDLFYLADPGVLILPSDMGRAPLAAMHGYDPADPTSDACFLADREVPLEAEHITAVLAALRRRIAGDA